MYFVGFIFKQFEVLYGFFNDICLLEKINYWNFRELVDLEKLIRGLELEFFCCEKFFIIFV